MIQQTYRIGRSICQFYESGGMVSAELAPGKMRMLKVLADHELKAYTTIKRGANIQDPSLIKYLREMLRDKLIEKDDKTRAYRITERGLREVHSKRLILTEDEILFVLLKVTGEGRAPTNMLNIEQSVLRKLKSRW